MLFQFCPILFSILISSLQMLNLCIISIDKNLKFESYFIALINCLVLLIIIWECYFYYFPLFLIFISIILHLINFIDCFIIWGLIGMLKNWDQIDIFNNYYFQMLLINHMEQPPTDKNLYSYTMNNYNKQLQHKPQFMESYLICIHLNYLK